MNDDPLAEIHAHVDRMVRRQLAETERLCEEAFMAQCETGYSAKLTVVYQPNRAQIGRAHV